MSDELLIALNPDPDSRLPYLLRLPLGGGMVFRTSGTWPRAVRFGRKWLLVAGHQSDR